MSENTSNGKPEILTGWHLDKRLSAGHIVTTAVVAASVFMWLANVDKRVELNTHAIKAMDQRQVSAEIRQAQSLTELKAEIRAGFDAVRQDMRLMTGRIDGGKDRL